MLYTVFQNFIFQSIVVLINFRILSVVNSGDWGLGTGDWERINFMTCLNFDLCDSYGFYLK